MRSRPSNLGDKPKSQQNLLSAERTCLERSNSNLKVRQQSRNKTTLTMNAKDAQKNSSKANKRIVVEKHQIQEILKKINLDINKKKPKKKVAKAPKTKAKPVLTQAVQVAANKSCININAPVTLVSPGNNDQSTVSLLAARKMLSPFTDQSSKPNAENTASVNNQPSQDPSIAQNSVKEASSTVPNLLQQKNN